MQTSLVITLLGTDRSGLVKSLSEAVKNHGGNWQESRMVQMGGQFAGLAHVFIEDEQADALKQDLLALQTEDLQILIKQSTPDATNATKKTLSFELLGADRSGIIHDITQHLAALNVNIEKLESEQRVAPMSNEVLFHADVIVGLPEGISEQDVREAFEEISDSLMVDVNFNR